MGGMAPIRKGTPALVSRSCCLAARLRGEAYRSDWYRIPDVGAAHREIQELYRANKDSDTEAALGRFRRKALTGNDLLVAHARKLADKVDAIYRSLAKPEPERRAEQQKGPQFPDLKEANLYGS